MWQGAPRECETDTMGDTINLDRKHKQHATCAEEIELWTISREARKERNMRERKTPTVQFNRDT